MPWRGPEHEGEFPSLGWDLIDFFEAHLKVPAGPYYGQALGLTDDQKRFFVRLYALTPTGSFVYRRATRRGAKGKGKSPEGGMYVVGEFVGPVQFDGWDADGEPVGRPRDYPWVQVAACSEDQDHNLYGPMREMIAESDLLDEYAIELGKTKVEFRDGKPGIIEPVTASAGAREGQPITAAALEETHLWFPSKGGPKLAAVLRRNVGKTNGRSVEFTNAPALGERSVAEDTLKAADEGQRGLLYDSTEGSYVDDIKNPENRDAVMAALAEAYDDGAGGIIPWVDLDRQYEELVDKDTTVADGYRFYLNIARKAENRAFDPQRFDELVEARPATNKWGGTGYTEADLSPTPFGADEPVLLMFDGARTRDCAGFTAWSIEETPHHVHVASWVRPYRADADYEHPRGEIRAAVREFLDAHRCVLFAYDSSFHELDSLYADWLDEWGEADEKGKGLVIGFPTASGQRMEKALKAVIEDVRAGLITHDGHPTVTEHIHNAIASKNRGGWLVLDKEKDGDKIDLAVTFTFGHALIPLARTRAALGTAESVYEERGLVTL